MRFSFINQFTCNIFNDVNVFNFKFQIIIETMFLVSKRIICNLFGNPRLLLSKTEINN